MLKCTCFDKQTKTKFSSDFETKYMIKMYMDNKG